MSLPQTNIQLEHVNDPCSRRSFHSYTSPNYVCLRCHRTSSPNYQLGLLIGLLYTYLCDSAVLQRTGAVLWTALHSLQHCSRGPEQYLVTPSEAIYHFYLEEFELKMSTAYRLDKSDHSENCEQQKAAFGASSHSRGSKVYVSRLYVCALLLSLWTLPVER